MLNLIFYHSRENRCSVNALAGAIETLENVNAVFPNTPAALREALQRSARGVTVAAFSFFTSQKEETAELVARLRADHPGTVFMAGGPHASAEPQETLALGFDYAVAGEGEKVFPELLLALAAGRAPAPGVIKGAKADLGAYPAVSERYGLFGPIEITRGCPFACTYCQNSFLFGARPRHRPLPVILSAMDAMLSRGLKDIRFITPDAFAYGSADGRALDLPALEEFMRSAHDLAAAQGGRIYVGSFPSEVRPEHVTPETLALVKKYAYNRRLVIGAQTATAAALKAIRRGHGPEDIMNAARLCKAHKITPYMDFILGLPGETAEDEDASMAMMTELAALGAMIHTHAFMPLPGTPLAGEPAAVIGPRMEAFILRLESRGKSFGKWKEHRAAARRRRG
jgi:B12-binding domain/radical SAM domain protein